MRFQTKRKQIVQVIARKIRAARIDHQLTQRALSKIMRQRGAGIYASNLCRIEKGIDDPYWSTVAIAAEAMELALPDLVTYDEPRVILGQRRVARRKRIA